MTLNETIEMMNSEDYVKRFKAEYYQLKIRMFGLGAMLAKYKSGTLSFNPTCSYDVLDRQLRIMTHYASILEKRAKIEKINLEE